MKQLQIKHHKSEKHKQSFWFLIEQDIWEIKPALLSDAHPVLTVDQEECNKV